MAEKREASRVTEDLELVLTHADIVDLMKDPAVGLNPADDETFQLFIRKANDADINLNLRPLYDTDKIVFRYSRVSLVETDDTFTDVDIS